MALAAAARPFVAKTSPRAAARRTTIVCASDPMQVVVTGAGGRTGALVMKKLLVRPSDFRARGVVRSDKSAAQLRGWGASDEQIVMGDLLENGQEVLSKAMEGADALVIATSAVPKIKPLSLIPVLLAKLTGKQGVRPEFTFKADQYPEQIDWLGQKAQIDAAKAAGVKKVVIISSMGGTQKDNFLNTIGNGNILVRSGHCSGEGSAPPQQQQGCLVGPLRGPSSLPACRSAPPDLRAIIALPLCASAVAYAKGHGPACPAASFRRRGSPFPTLQVWKRKAEKYLVDSGLTHTIVHPGGLIDKEGGKRQLIIDVDDKLIAEGSKHRSIPRADVAELCVQCLLLPEAENRSVDLVSKEPGDAPPTTDFAALLREMPRNCSYADMDATVAA
ncbi:hypothetical protein ABPG75_002231 [Micractinium tetrahymenae]